MKYAHKDFDGQLRIGAVSYLNTKPLVYKLAEAIPTANISYDCPSQLADSLAAGSLDIALVPAIEFASHPEWSIVSDACIGCLGPVLSVKLLFRKNPGDVRTLALDEGSRTSVVLAQILLHELHGVHPQCETFPLDGSYEETDADAILLIGDRAIRCSEEEFQEVWDLGDRWCRWADLPFVFAFWVARAGLPTEEVEHALRTARDQGALHLQEIASEQSESMQLPYKLVEDYLCQNLHFRLGHLQRKGLDLYYQKAAQLGFIQNQPRVFVDDCQVEHS